MSLSDAPETSKTTSADDVNDAETVIIDELGVARL